MKEDQKAMQLIEKLRECGIRPTRQRMALADLLFSKGDRHVTAESLYDEASAQRMNVSLATVYNTLHQFTRHGLLREVHLDADVRWFDTNTSHHHHFIFKDTGDVCDIPSGTIHVDGVPSLPAGQRVHHIEVIVHLASSDTPHSGT